MGNPTFREYTKTAAAILIESTVPDGDQFFRIGGMRPQFEQVDDFTETFLIVWRDAGIVVPWPEGMTAREALLAWADAERAHEARIADERARGCTCVPKRTSNYGMPVTIHQAGCGFRFDEGDCPVVSSD